MQARSATWVSLYADLGHRTEYKAVIAGTEYGEDKINASAPVISRTLFADTLSIGETNTATLSMTLSPQGVIPKMADIVIYMRLRSADGTTVSEWLPQGTFYIDTRKTDAYGWMSLECFDGMLKAEQTFINPDSESGEWPITMADAVAEICTRIGVTLDSRTVLHTGSDYVVDYPNDLTMREVLGYIGAAHGGSWIITPTNELRLVVFSSPGASADLAIGQSCVGFNSSAAVVISRVTLYDDTGNSYTAGDDSGYHIEADCPYATQTLADNLCNPADGTLYGAVYRPYEAFTAYLDPAYELGDTVSVNGVTSVLATVVVTQGAGHTADISAPMSFEAEHEYPYLSKIAREAQRAVKLNSPYYGVAISRRNGLEIKKTDNTSEAIFNSDVLAMRSVVDGQMKDAIFFDSDKRKYHISGDVLIDGTLSSDANFTDSIYAERGNVSELTVDYIDTSKRVKKYLLGDTSDDNHFVGHDMEIQFITASVKMDEDGVTPLEEQLENRYGDLLYWNGDISQATIDANGYPFLDDVQLYTQVEETDWPVMVYQRVSQVKRSMEFAYDPETENYLPNDIYGTGSDPDNPSYGKGRIMQDTDEFKMIYTTSKGKETGIYHRDDGFSDVSQRRASITVDTSAGSITISPEGSLATQIVINYTENNGVLTLTWPDGEQFTVGVT
jgi:hypothetical protein